MSDEALKNAARRRYELGRWSAAWRTSMLAVPMVLISLSACNRPEVTVGLGIALVIACALFSWRGQALGKAVLPGLLAGFLAAMVPWCGFRLGLCAGGAMVGLCQAVCLAGGGLAGATIAARAVRLSDGRRRFIVASAVIACLTGSLGCLLAGLGGVLGMAIGVLVLTAPVAIGARAEG